MDTRFCWDNWVFTYTISWPSLLRKLNQISKIYLKTKYFMEYQAA